MSTAALTREEWLTERRSGIGASDSPALLGAYDAEQPWKTPFSVWAEKTGLAEPEEIGDNEAAEFGLRLEPVICEAYSARTSRLSNLWPQYEIVREAVYPWLTCTPDATQVSPDHKTPGLLQIKTCSAYKASEWSDGPPLAYQVQLQHELAVTGYPWGTLVCLIGGQRLKWFDVERNDRFIDAMIPKLAEFWRLVETRTPPPIDGSLATARVLARLHPDDSGETVCLPPESAEWTEELESLKRQIKDAESRKTLLENQIKAALEDATWGVLPDGSRWQWKTQNRKAYSVEETTTRVLRKVK